MGAVRDAKLNLDGSSYPLRTDLSLDMESKCPRDHFKLSKTKIGHVEPKLFEFDVARDEMSRDEMTRSQHNLIITVTR